ARHAQGGHHGAVRAASARLRAPRDARVRRVDVPGLEPASGRGDASTVGGGSGAVSDATLRVGQPRPGSGTAGRVRVRVGRDSARPLVSREAVERIAALLAPVILLLLWEGLVQARILDRRFFPAPSSIVGTFWQLARTTLPGDIGISLSRALIGFLL